MNGNKQIEEMARTMCFQRESCTAKSCTRVNCETTWLAEKLYNADYRKTSDVTREIFKDIDYMLLMMFEEYASLGHREYSAVIEVVHHKLRALEKKYVEAKNGIGCLDNCW